MSFEYLPVTDKSLFFMLLELQEWLEQQQRLRDATLPCNSARHDQIMDMIMTMESA